MLSEQVFLHFTNDFMQLDMTNRSQRKEVAKNE